MAQKWDGKWQYIRLLDNDSLGMVMRLGPIGNQWLWDKRDGWVNTGYYLAYCMPESDLYGAYETITEKEALMIIGTDK